LEAIQRDLGTPETWVDVHTYPNSMAECIIDALWSERVRYSVIGDIIQRYQAFRTGEGGDADSDSARSLLDTFSIGIQAWMDRIGNRQRAYSRDDAPFKAELVRDGAQAAVDSGITTTEALRRDHTRNTAGITEFRNRWFELPSQRSGLTWERLLLVAGVTQVPPDGWIIEYLARETGLAPSQTLTAAEAEPIIETAAKELHSTPLRLRNSIWRFEAKRDRRMGHGPRGSHAARPGAIAGEAG
jgi:hypothetical protein